jgi:hypothetical protein
MEERLEGGYSLQTCVTNGLEGMIRLMVSGSGVRSARVGGGSGGGGGLGMLLLPPGKASSNLLSVLEAELRRTADTLAATTTPLLHEPSRRFTTAHAATTTTTIPSTSSSLSPRQETTTLTNIVNTLVLLACHPDLAAEMVRRHLLPHIAQWEVMKPFYGTSPPPLPSSSFPGSTVRGNGQRG